MKTPRSFVAIWLVLLMLAAAIGMVVWRVEQQRMEFQRHIIKAAEFCQLGRMEGILVEMTYAKMAAQSDNDIALANAIQRRFTSKTCELAEPGDPMLPL